MDELLFDFYVYYFYDMCDIYDSFPLSDCICICVMVYDYGSVCVCVCVYTGLVVMGCI